MAEIKDKKLLEQKLEALLQDRHQEAERNSSLSQKQQVLSIENEELKSKLKDLRDVSNLKCAGGSCNDTAPLKQREQKQSNERAHSTNLCIELSDAVAPCGKITTPCDKDESLILKAKLLDLESCLALKNQELEHVKSERDSYLEHLGSVSAQLATLESQLNREKSFNAHLETRVGEQEDDVRKRSAELQVVLNTQTELQSEILTLRKRLQSTQQTEAELKQYQKELQQRTSTYIELERKMFSTSSELRQFQKQCTDLKQSEAALQEEKELLSSSLDIEKEANKKLKATIDMLNANLKSSNKRLECLVCENIQSKKELTRNKQELVTAQNEVQSLTNGLKETEARCASIHADLEESQRKSELQSKDLSQTREITSIQRQKLLIASKDLDSCKEELQEVKAQLAATKSTNSDLMKRKEFAERQVQDLEGKLEKANGHCVLKGELVQVRESEIDNLKQENKSLSDELTLLKGDYQILVSSKAKVDNELLLHTSELNSVTRSWNEVIQQLNVKEKELNATKLEVEKMQCFAAFEAERYSTLQIEMTAIEKELRLCVDHRSVLEADLQLLQKQHHDECEHTNNMVLKLQQELQLTQAKNSDLRLQLTSLLSAKKETESLLYMENGELKTKLSLMTTELNDIKDVESSLQQELSVKNNEIDEMKAAAIKEKASNENAAKELKSLLVASDTEVKLLSKKLDSVQNDLEEEKSKLINACKKLEASEAMVSTLQNAVGCGENELQTERARTEYLTSDLLKSENRNQELSKQLHLLHQEKDHMEKTHTKLSESLRSLTTIHVEEQKKLQAENYSLCEELTQHRERLAEVEEKLHATEEELVQRTNKLTLVEQKCMQLESVLKSGESIHKNLEAHYAQLQSENAEANMNISNLMAEISSSTQECEALRDQLRLQSETATASIDNIHKQNREKCSEYHSKIQGLIEKLKEAHSSIRTLQQDIFVTKSENAELNNAIVQERERCLSLREQLKEEILLRQRTEQQAEQFEASTIVERNAKIHLQDSLEAENTLRAEYERANRDLKKELSSTSHDLSVCRAALTNETLQHEQLKKDIQVVKEKLTTAECELNITRESLKTIEIKCERETSLMEKYHSEKKSLKEKLKQVQNQMQILRAQYESCGGEVSQLEAKNRDLSAEQRDMHKRLIETELTLQTKKQECEDLRLKVHTMDVHAAQLEQELSAMCKIQIETEEQKKKAEARSKSQVQHLLSEVTGHMEQQYTAHRYLERLRVGNEAIALKEKDRQISQLKNELKLKKRECKVDQIHIEQLELEAKHFKSQQISQAISRRRLEARLEQVNNSLNRSLPQPKTASAPYSSTPISSSSLYC